MKIIFTGGGTIGSVSPLLAIKDTIEESGKAAEFLWVGTKNGIEKEIVGKEKMPYLAIWAAKWRRYLNWQMFIDPIRFVVGFLQSLLVIKTFKPDYIISAGGFVGVPMIWAGWCLRKICVIHQQD
ncbi:MAG: glycosyltransferase, partial [Parcubacteria group bacterium]